MEPCKFRNDCIRPLAEDEREHNRNNTITKFDRAIIMISAAHRVGWMSSDDSFGLFLAVKCNILSISDGFQALKMAFLSSTGTHKAKFAVSCFVEARERFKYFMHVERSPKTRDKFSSSSETTRPRLVILVWRPPTTNHEIRSIESALSELMNTLIATFIVLRLLTTPQTCLIQSEFVAKPSDNMNRSKVLITLQSAIFIISTFLRRTNANRLTEELSTIIVCKILLAPNDWRNVSDRKKGGNVDWSSPSTELIKARREKVHKPSKNVMKIIPFSGKYGWPFALPRLFFHPMFMDL